MGSKSKPLSQEEQDTMRTANNEAATKMANNRRTVVQSGFVKAAPGVGTVINNMSDDGLSFMGNNGYGRAKYKYNDRTGMYHAEGGDTVSLGEVAQQAPEAAAPTAAPTAAPKDWRDDIDYSKSEGPEGMTTDQIVDNAGMGNWMKMGPQTAGQHINPLVDPANWQHQVDPQYQQTRNLGRYNNPVLDAQVAQRRRKGLLAYSPGGIA
jgi:hypothetical protein